MEPRSWRLSDSSQPQAVRDDLVGVAGLEPLVRSARARRRAGVGTMVAALLGVAALGSCSARAPSSPEVAPASAPEPNDATNSVVAYLSGAEIQAETDAQRAELRAAFRDMLALSAAELQARRYAGHDGQPGALTLVQLLTAHVVPPTPQALVPARFFEDVKRAVAQDAIRAKLTELEQAPSSLPH
jgi:hypothetical protein